MSDSLARDSKRRFLRVPVRVEVVSAGRGQFDYAINLSRGGLCLQTAKERQPGEQLRLCFRLEVGGKELSVDAEVAWCTCEADRGPGMRYCEMGLRFLSPSAADALEIDRFVEDATHFLPDPG